MRILRMRPVILMAPIDSMLDFLMKQRLADPMAFYAIRLSNCLMAWAKLADDFPGASHELGTKRSRNVA